ncbi:hypothetical protein F441_15174 [Phytophthora nicotianae CJ01A1]|uniref:SWIM-type domain-containing protein n=1 Tax=Phytophthora nicotianae CJ01A1 TaxID=1317063 RepID=W2WEL0_PHYNI|nr:hypothetical protein F441_15174 [Phytophthora nicotianae CJ01A1]
MWDVTTNGKRYACNDIEWTCTCPFWTSLMLPCQHLMYVCRYGHGFEELPIMTILSRWSMAEATKLFRQIEKNASSIDTVTSTISLSGTGFYKALEKWEDFVAGAVKNTDKVSDTSDTDEDNYDVDITDYYDAVQLVEEMEKMQYEEEKEEEDICPPTQPSTVVTLTQSATLTEQATLTETAANSAKAPTTPPLPATLSATATLPASVEPGAAQGVHVTAAEMPLSAFAPATYSEFEEAPLSQISLGVINMSESSQRTIEATNDTVQGVEADSTPAQRGSNKHVPVTELVADNQRDKLSSIFPVPTKGNLERSYGRSCPRLLLNHAM